MAIVDVVYRLPTGELAARVCWHGPKVGGHFMLFWQLSNSD